MNIVIRMFCGFLLCVISIVGMSNIVEAAPTCITLKFSDRSSYSDLSTANLLSDLLMETLMNERKFVFKEMGILDEDTRSKLYDKDWEQIKLFNDCKNVNDFFSLFTNKDFGVENTKKMIYEAEEGDIIYPEIMSMLGNKYDVNHILHCTINNIGASQGFGTAIPFIHVTIDGAKYIQIEAYVRLINCQDGKVIWGRNIVGQAEKWSGSVSDLSIGSKYPDSAMYYNACNAVVKNFMKELNDDMISGKLKFNY